MEPTERWSVQDASELYDVASWGKGYFSVGDNGHVRVHPEKDPARSIDLKELIDTLVLRGINLPILIRFADILKHRLGEIHSAFATAIAEHKYQGDYCCVYPFKDDEYIEMAMLAQKMGRRIIPVVEKYTELHLILKYSARVGVKPSLGLRVKLASRGSGRWKSSGGFRSKF